MIYFKALLTIFFGRVFVIVLPPHLCFSCLEHVSCKTRYDCSLLSTLIYFSHFGMRARLSGLKFWLESWYFQSNVDPLWPPLETFHSGKFQVLRRACIPMSQRNQSRLSLNSFKWFWLFLNWQDCRSSLSAEWTMSSHVPPRTQHRQKLCARKN